MFSLRDHEYFLEEKIIGNQQTSTVLHAENCEHQVTADYVSSEVLWQEFDRISRLKGTPNGDEQVRCDIADHRPDGQEAYTYDRRRRDEQCP